MYENKIYFLQLNNNLVVIKRITRQAVRSRVIPLYMSDVYALCIDVCICSILLDKLATGTYILAHEH